MNCLYESSLFGTDKVPENVGKGGNLANID